MRDAIERLSREFANNILRVIVDTAGAAIKAEPVTTAPEKGSAVSKGKPRGLAALPFEKRQEIARRAAQTRKRRQAARKGVETRKARKAA